MTNTDMANEALSRATGNQSVSNYVEIYRGFMALGIPEDQIKPRENVFTFWAWKALGKHVKRGQHGIHITTWVHRSEKKEDGKERTYSFPKSAVVFHASQVE